MYDDTATPPTTMYRSVVVQDAPTEPGVERAYLLGTQPPVPATGRVQPQTLFRLDDRDLSVLVAAAVSTVVLIAAILLL